LEPMEGALRELKRRSEELLRVCARLKEVRRGLRPLARRHGWARELRRRVVEAERLKRLAAFTLTAGGARIRQRALGDEAWLEILADGQRIYVGDRGMWVVRPKKASRRLEALPLGAEGRREVMEALAAKLEELGRAAAEAKEALAAAELLMS